MQSPFSRSRVCEDILRHTKADVVRFDINIGIQIKVSIHPNTIGNFVFQVDSQAPEGQMSRRHDRNDMDTVLDLHSAYTMFESPRLDQAQHKLRVNVDSSALYSGGYGLQLASFNIVRDESPAALSSSMTSDSAPPSTVTLSLPSGISSQAEAPASKSGIDAWGIGEKDGIAIGILTGVLTMGAMIYKLGKKNGWWGKTKLQPLPSP